MENIKIIIILLLTLYLMMSCNKTSDESNQGRLCIQGFDCQVIDDLTIGFSVKKDDDSLRIYDFYVSVSGKKITSKIINYYHHRFINDITINDSNGNDIKIIDFYIENSFEPNKTFQGELSVNNRESNNNKQSIIIGYSDKNNFRYDFKE